MPRQLRSKLWRLKKALKKGKLDPAEFSVDARDRGDNWVSSDGLYLNEELGDLFTRAEMERTDYRKKYHPNIFFGAKRQFQLKWWDLDGNRREKVVNIKTVYLDALVLLGFGIVVVTLVWLSVLRKMRSV